MRIKINGSISAKELGLLIMKVMKEQGQDVSYSANVYVSGGGDKVVTVSATSLHDEPKYRKIKYRGF